MEATPRDLDLRITNSSDTSSNAGLQPDSEPGTSYQTNRLTRLGIHFFIIGAMATFGGAIKGINLLLVLTSLIVSALLMHWRWTHRSIESISVRRRLPGEAFAGKPFRVRYALRNHARFMPAWMIRIEDKLKTENRKNGSATTACAAGVIAPSASILPYNDVTVTLRGKYRFGPAVIQTSFPFTMFLSRKVSESYQSLYVFPKLLKLSGAWYRKLPSRVGGIATTARRSGAPEGEFFGLREWQTGDSLKWVHWRSTARLGEPAVRQFEQQRRFCLVIVVDAHQGQNDESGETVEYAISLAATLVVHLVGAPSNRVALAVAGARSDAVVGGGNNLGKRRMMEVLAATESVENPNVEDAIETIVKLSAAPQDMVVVSSRSIQAAASDRGQLESMLAPWKRRGGFQWIDASQKEVRRWAIEDSVDKRFQNVPSAKAPLSERVSNARPER